MTPPFFIFTGMKYLPLLLFPLFIAIGTLSSCGGSDEKASETASGPNGKALYQNNCVLCHGVSGGLGASGSKDLRETTLSQKGVVEIIRNGKGQMNAFSSLLSPEEINAIANYVGTLK